jgi:hypothetical protein
MRIQYLNHNTIDACAFAKLLVHKRTHSLARLLTLVDSVGAIVHTTIYGLC